MNTVLAIVIIGCGQAVGNDRGAGGPDGGVGGASSGTGGSSFGGSGTNAGGNAAAPTASGGLGAGAGAGGGGGIFDVAPTCIGTGCPSGRQCCLLDGQCFDPANEAACPTPREAPDDRGQAACSTQADCEPGEFCQPDATVCLGPGRCVDRCRNGNGIVCGCDGRTYDSPQDACAAGVRFLDHRVGCGEIARPGAGGVGNEYEPYPEWQLITVCGVDEQCPAGQRCCSITGVCFDPARPGDCANPPPDTEFPCQDDDSCYLESWFCDGPGCDGPGGCRTRVDEDCGVIFEPVCGCDGTTYTSAACARERGVRVASTGECAE